MEGSKAFGAPLTAFNDGSVSTDNEPKSPSQDARSKVDLPDGEEDTLPDSFKNDVPGQGIDSKADVEETLESRGDDKSFEEY